MRSKNISKSELIETLAQKFKIENDVSSKAVNAILQSMITELANGGRIEIRGFGSLNLKHEAPRVYRNPRTGVTTNEKTITKVHFKPGYILRDKINQYVSHCDSKSPK